MFSLSTFLCFQFDCTNTLNDQQLENVTVHMESHDGFDIVKMVQCPLLLYDKPGTAYTVVELPDDPTVGRCIVIGLVRFYAPFCIKQI